MTPHDEMGGAGVSPRTTGSREIEVRDPVAVEFLIRAAREFRRGGWVFTGFHWPVLAGQLAHSLEGEPFRQVFEAGAVTDRAADIVPTSTTDYAAYGNAIMYAGSTADVLLAMARRLDRVVLDASNIDLAGRVNSSIIGPTERPTVRLPGGGGAPDIAARARELVWLFGSASLSRLHDRLEHVTAAPGPHTLVRAHTRWGVVRLGEEPTLEEIADVAGVDDFRARLVQLGVEVSGAVDRPVSTPADRAAAVALLVEAAGRGYGVAQRAVVGSEG